MTTHQECTTHTFLRCHPLFSIHQSTEVTNSGNVILQYTTTLLSSDDLHLHMKHKNGQIGTSPIPTLPTRSGERFAPAWPGASTDHAIRIHPSHPFLPIPRYPSSASSEPLKSGECRFLGIKLCLASASQRDKNLGLCQPRSHNLLAPSSPIHCNRITKEYGCRFTLVDHGGSANVETACTTGTASTTFSSAHVIVTVLLSVLKDGNIAFVPALLAGIQENVDSRDWFHGFKLFVKFDTR